MSSELTILIPNDFGLAKRYIKHNIDEMENSNTQDWKNRQVVLEIYNKSTYEIDQFAEFGLLILLNANFTNKIHVTAIGT